MADSRKSSLLAYWIGLGLVGAAVGYFVGFSQSPVIATLLPLLFGTLGTGGIIVVGTAKLEEANSRERLKYIGVGLSVFSLTIILSSAAALAIKNRRIAAAEAQLQLSGESAVAGIKLLALRKKLEVLGATAEEQKLVLGSAMALRKIPPADKRTVQKYLGEVVTTSAQALGLIDSLTASGQIDTTENSWQEVHKLRPLLAAAGQLFAQWNDTIEKGEKTPYWGIAKQAELLQHQLDEILGNHNTVRLTSMETLSKVPELYSALISLRTAVVEERPALAAVESSGIPSGEIEDKLVEQLLTIGRGQVAERKVHYFAINPLDLFKSNPEYQ